jgi:hypothetical protein
MALWLRQFLLRYTPAKSATFLRGFKKMAFCTSCGKPLENRARFCANCGMAVAASAAMAATLPEASSVPAGALTAAAASPAQSPVAPAEAAAQGTETPAVPALAELPLAPEPAISPFLVIICIILVLLIGAGIAATLYLRNQSKPNSEAQAGLKAPGAPPAASRSPVIPDSIRALNLGNYPGATPVAITTLSGDTVVAGFLTKDRPEQVIQFYKIRFPVSSATSTEGKAQLSARLPAGERIRIDAQPQGASTQVMIVQEH